MEHRFAALLSKLETDVHQRLDSVLQTLESAIDMERIARTAEFSRMGQELLGSMQELNRRCEKSMRDIIERLCHMEQSGLPANSARITPGAPDVELAAQVLLLSERFEALDSSQRELLSLAQERLLAEAEGEASAVRQMQAQVMRVEQSLAQVSLKMDSKSEDFSAAFGHESANDLAERAFRRIFEAEQRHKQDEMDLKALRQWLATLEQETMQSLQAHKAHLLAFRTYMEAVADAQRAGIDWPAAPQLLDTKESGGTSSWLF